ncbi:MAG: D-alanyl-D-alanine carboxypeptidase/D-alanyl-D-alanine-endopeptidase [Candidatus Kapaibacterium sp.]
MINLLKRPAAIFACILLYIVCSTAALSQAPATVNPPKSSLFTPADSARVISNFAKEIELALDDKYISASETGLAIYSLDARRFYYQKNIDKALTPASTTKLITSFTAFARLGKDFRLRTRVYTDAFTIGDSVLRGNLYLVGRGNAMLGVSDIEYLADQLGRYGIRRIEGDICADDTYFDSITDRKDYSGDADHVVVLPPVTALGIERNIATVLVNSGARAGDYVDVQLIPDSDMFSRWITAKVRGYGKSYLDNEGDLQFGSVENNQVRRAGDEEYIASAAAARRTVRVSSKLLESGKQHFTVRGYLYPNKTVSYRYHILEPALAAAGTLRNRLESGGIAVTGETRIKPLAEADSGRYLTLLAEFSRPMLDMIYELNKESDNFLAEHLFKIIGAEVGKSPKTSDDTRITTIRTLDSLGVPFKGCLVNDGSGLSRRNLLTVHTLIEILKKSEKMRFGLEFDSTLALAGIDGTLEKRMGGTMAESNLHAKTGTLRNVSALAGYVRTRDGERLCFAFLFRGRYVSHYKDVEDKLGAIMSQFFYYHEKH